MVTLFIHLVGCYGGTSRRYGNNDVLFCPKNMAKWWFWPLYPFLPQFQHCHMTYHQILHKPCGLPWWHKPSLWQQWCHTLSKNHGQIILIPSSPLSHNFNIVTWLSIEFSIHLVGCHGGTSHGNNDVLFCPKNMAKWWFWPLYPLFARVSTLSHDPSSNSTQIQWVAIVAQAVVMATITS